MTKLPSESWQVKGVEGPKYRVGPGCAVPGCAKFADHAHHIWRRSFLAGDYRWVELFDRTVVQNLTGLCAGHHQLVTESPERVLSYGDDGVFHWISLDTFGPLSPQPKTLEQFETDSQLTLDGGEVPHEHVVAEGQSGKSHKCPTCGKSTKKEADLVPGPKRGRATWSVSVPKDERENGAEVLDTLELECATLLEREEHASHKYFVLAEVMAYFLQSYQAEAS